MDVECEAPLNNSFQKERRELVNKGSLGRRRKPTRSNLRLILSPSDDRQDIDSLFHPEHLESELSFNQQKVNHLQDSVLDNQPPSNRVKYHTNSFNHLQNSHLGSVPNNYREVVASINQINRTKSIDLNGNNRQTTSNNRQRISSINQEEININGQRKSLLKNGSVNSEHSSQVYVIKKQQKVTANLSNGHHTSKINGYNCDTSSKSEKNSEIRNNHQPVITHSYQEITSTPKSHQNIITFSNRRQIVTPLPVQTTKASVHNGNHYVASSKNRLSSQQIEPSLPRTSKGPSLVDEARQFSIEAKLKRKKSEAQGRSAVLIQTWERRTHSESHSESHSKLRRDSIDAPNNRFGGTENCDTSAMPDSYICIKYKGSLQNGDSLQEGELVPSVRDVRREDTMLYRVAEDRSRRVHLSGSSSGSVTNKDNSSVQEPEWISLSRKLCAKFVEGHIEPHSTDSYQHEEPAGVGEEPVPSPQPTKIHSGPVTRTVQTDLQKNKPVNSVSTAPCEEIANGEEPPWIHLSRKLCNKFIEEHIEYPPITNGHFVEVPELVEPNGDVRIIEKVGKPKKPKSKQKKESEPEWVSLSKKLRAKFIESHIDDPNTISLDNQLNASDPEETGSETLSDISQDTPVPRESSFPERSVETKSTSKKNEVLENGASFKERNIRQDIDKCHRNNESNTPPEKECCWEYQEMEFDTESNSGNFQEPEGYDQPLQEARIQRKSFVEDNSDKIEERITFADCHTFRGPECLNNDVNFAPRISSDESIANNSQHKKLITVQFIAHSKKDQSRDISGKTDFPQVQTEVQQEPFFNLSTWEEAHYQEEQLNNCETSDVTLSNDIRSKSLDNLCDSLETNATEQEENFNKYKKRNSFHSTVDFDGEENFVFMSEKPLKRKENENILDDELNSESFNEVRLMKRNDNCNCVAEDTLNESENNHEYSILNSRENEQNIRRERVENRDERIRIEVNQESKQTDNTVDDKQFAKFKVYSVKGNGNYNCISRDNANESDYDHEFSSFCSQESNQNIHKETNTEAEDRIRNEINQNWKQKENNAVNGKSYPKTLNDNFSTKQNGNCNYISEDMVYESENNTASSSFRSQESEQKSPERRESEVSSEDEVFECSSRSRKQAPSSVEGNCYGKISPKRHSEESSKGKHSVQKQMNGEISKNDSSTKNKNAKCNGFIPNSYYNGFPGKQEGSVISKYSHGDTNKKNGSKEPPKMGMSKWITISKSEQNIHKPEYKNISQTSIQTNQKKPSLPKAELKSKSISKSEQNINMPEYSNLIQSNQTVCKSSDLGSESNYKPQKNNVLSIGESDMDLCSKEKVSPNNEISRQESTNSSDCNGINGYSNESKESSKNSDLKFKCKSLCDISNAGKSNIKENSFRQHESIADLCSVKQTDDYSKIEFQHFDCDSEIPLCAKLVSNHEKGISRKIPSSAADSRRDESPSPSESSHVYEDMFKETPSGPSDSEASSWSVMKNNTYYVNGRSSSMNDLDLSDSCSMSVKCDYASSSENSTLQSRHSSCASSSFYVNLRDYDSHMLEPSFSKSKRSNGNTINNGMPSSISKSNPPTPESLRHLFTSPLNSIHSPPHRNPRMLSRMPSDPQSHYYSTAAATSSAFKHGFAPTSPKQKKTERSSSIKIKDIAHGIILTFKRFHNHSKSSNVPSAQQVDVSHLAEMKSNSELGKGKKGNKETKSKNQDRSYLTDGRTDSDSGFLSDVQRAKARRSSSDLTDWKSNSDLFGSDKKKGKSKKSNNRDKGKKSKSKVSEPRTIPTVSRKVQQMADGTLYLVTTVSGDSSMPGVYSDSPDTSSELSGHKPVKPMGESNC